MDQCIREIRDRVRYRNAVIAQVLQQAQLFRNLFPGTPLETVHAENTAFLRRGNQVGVTDTGFQDPAFDLLLREIMLFKKNAQVKWRKGGIRDGEDVHGIRRLGRQNYGYICPRANAL